MTEKDPAGDDQERVESQPSPAIRAMGRKSLAGKLIGITVLILLGLGAANLFVVHRMNRGAAKHNLENIEELIQSALEEKGRVLTENHALAMRTMVADNAFGDIQSLVYRAIREDDELVYGLFLDEQSTPWVYASPTTPPPASEDEDLGSGNANAWRELALVDELLEEDVLAVRNVQLFGQNIIEFGIPVWVEGENLGTVRYGISTTKMKEALSAARQKSSEATAEQLRALLVVVLATTFLGIVVVRRQAFRVTRPLGDLTQAANQLASGVRNVQVQVDSKDEIQVLAAAFNKMVADLAASYEELESLNQELEARVEARTEELASRNLEMRRIFENVEQGFISLDCKGVMADERSAIVETWFGSCASSTSFVEFMFANVPGFADHFDVAWDQLMDGFLPRDIAIAMLPSSFHFEGRDFEASYSLLSEERDGQDVWSGVLVVIDNVTEKLALERSQRRQHEFAHALNAITRDASGYAEFVDETSRHVEVALSTNYLEDANEGKRAIHTIKGNTAALSIASVAELCHRIEEYMADEDGPPAQRLLDELEERWTEHVESIRFMLNRSDMSRIALSEDTYRAHLQAVYDRSDHRLFDEVFSWQLKPARNGLTRLAEQARVYAKRLDKEGVDIVVEDTAGGIDATCWSTFWSELTHVVRNAVDHGLGSSSGAQAPRLAFRAFETDESFVVEIEDNGRGIDWTKVATKARDAGMPWKERSDLVDALFSDGFTTRDSLSSYSGRGMGMAAVRTQVSSMKGEIEVESEPNQGTCFRFRFPRSQMRSHLYESSLRRVEQVACRAS